MAVDWSAIGAVAELLGAIGVIASLVYLAGQVRNAGRLGREEAARSVMAKLNSTMAFLASGHDKADMWVRGSGGFSNLKDESEVVQLSGFLLTFFRAYEELYFYRKAGVDWDWGGFEAQVRATINTPGGSEWWATRGHYFSQEFQQEIGTYLTEPIVPLYGSTTRSDQLRKGPAPTEEIRE